MKPSHALSAVFKSFAKRNCLLPSRFRTSTSSVKFFLACSNQGSKFLFCQNRDPQLTGLLQFRARISSCHHVGSLFTHARRYTGSRCFHSLLRAVSSEVIKSTGKYESFPCERGFSPVAGGQALTHLYAGFSNLSDDGLIVRFRPIRCQTF